MWHDSRQCQLKLRFLSTFPFVMNNFHPFGVKRPQQVLATAATDKIEDDFALTGGGVAQVLEFAAFSCYRHFGVDIEPSAIDLYFAIGVNYYGHKPSLNLQIHTQQLQSEVHG